MGLGHVLDLPGVLRLFCREILLALFTHAPTPEGKAYIRGEVLKNEGDLPGMKSVADSILRKLLLPGTYSRLPLKMSLPYSNLRLNAPDSMSSYCIGHESSRFSERSYRDQTNCTSK